jgi:hypothetical protein
MKNKRIGILIALAALGFIAALAYNTMSYSAVKVEVCMEFQGRQDCRAASGATEQLALRAATDLACALIASGMTDSIACSNTPPKSVKWLKK